MRSPTLLFVPIIVLLSACAAKTQLTYSQVSENRDGLVRFTLPQSQILVVASKQAGGKPEVSSVPTDAYASPKNLLVRGEQSLLQETNLMNVTFLDNTTLVTTVGFETVSKTNDLIKLASAVVPLIASSGGTTGTGAALVSTVVDPEERASFTDMPDNPSWKYMMVYDAPVADGSVEYDSFTSMTSSPLGVFPTSHCRSAKFTLQEPDGKTIYTYALKVADPSRLNLVKVPNKGTIKMHSACGFDVTATAAGGLVDYESLSSLVKLANDLKKK